MSLAEAHDPYGFSEQADFSGRIAGASGNVLPRLDEDALIDALRRLPADELELSLRCKLVPVVSLPGLHLFAACGEPALEMARHDGLKVVAYADDSDFVAAALKVHGRGLLHEATDGLAHRRPALSASRRMTTRQVVAAIVLLTVAAAAVVFLPLKLAWILASAVSGLFFLSVIALRVLCLLPAPRREVEAPQPISDDELPVYSVVVPLFRETSVLGQLLTALTDLDYPALCINRTRSRFLT